MKGNLRWFFALTVLIAAAAFLRPSPQQPAATPTPSPAVTPTPQARLVISFYEKNAHKESFTFLVEGFPGARKFRARWVVGTRSIEDERGLMEEDVRQIQQPLEAAYLATLHPRPLLEGLQPAPRSNEVVEFSYQTPGANFSGANCTPADPQIWKRLHSELANTKLGQEQVLLRKELHARFGR